VSAAAYVSFVSKLTELLPAKLQKVRCDDDGKVALELFAGRKVPLLIDPRPPRPHARISDAALAREQKPPAHQAVLRKELVPSRLVQVVLEEELGLLRFAFERPDGGTRALLLELSADDPRVVLVGDFADKRRVLASVGAPRPRDGRDVRRGRDYEAPRAPGPLPEGPLDDGAAEAADERRAADAHAQQTRAARGRLKAEARRLTRLDKRLRGDLERHGDGDALAADGELLKTALGRLRRGQEEVVLPDWSGGERTIRLDPARTPQQNLESFFHRARRAKEAARRVAPRLEAVLARRARVDELRAGPADGAEVEAWLARVEEALEDERAAASPRRRVAKDAPRRAWRAFRISGGLIARVGRSAKDNDALTFKKARGNDLWLHARGTAGAHVVVAHAHDDVSEEAVLDAAHLAAWFSPLREAERVDVQMAPRKQVKKPGKGSAAGFVHVHKERVMHLRVDRARTEQLLRAEVAD
jgi:predicted ribosome quality control (RQC) complex YloA/Tae2 family protein